MPSEWCQLAKTAKKEGLRYQLQNHVCSSRDCDLKVTFLLSCPMHEYEAEGKKKAKRMDPDRITSEYNRCQEIKARIRRED